MPVSTVAIDNQRIIFFIPAKNTPKLSENVFIHTQDSDLFRATGNPAGISEE